MCFIKSCTYEHYRTIILYIKGLLKSNQLNGEITVSYKIIDVRLKTEGHLTSPRFPASLPQ